MMLSKTKSQRVLLVSGPGIGDTMLATPIIKSLKAYNPQLHITCLVRESAKDVIKEFRDLDNVIGFSNKNKILDYIKLIKLVWNKYDFAITTSTSDRSILAAFYAAKKRIGIIEDNSAFKFWQKLILHKYIHQDLRQNTVLQNLMLCELVHVPPIYFVSTPLELGNRFDIDSSKQNILLHCYGSGEHKSWPIRNWRELIQKLNRSSYEVILSGSSQTEENIKLKAIAKNLSVKNLAGKLNFKELAQVIKQTDCIVSVDTCTAHLASSLNKKTIALFGSTNIEKWSPWPYGYQKKQNPFLNKSGMQRNKNVITIKGNCRCAKFTERCENKSSDNINACMNDISVADVYDHIVKKL